MDGRDIEEGEGEKGKGEKGKGEKRAREKGEGGRERT